MATTASSRAAQDAVSPAASAVPNERSPFARTAELLAPHQPGKPLITLSLGEPQHPAPGFVAPVLSKYINEFARYPVARGIEPFRRAAAKRAWGCAVGSSGWCPCSGRVPATAGWPTSALRWRTRWTRECRFRRHSSKRPHCKSTACCANDCSPGLLACRADRRFQRRPARPGACAANAWARRRRRPLFPTFPRPGL